MKSPFKLLDAYTVTDKELFFGRKKEINLLYELVFTSPLILIYGQSGTGKTSLVQCGLAGRFKGPDWFPLFIRKQDNILDALHAALNHYVPDGEGMSTVEKVRYITFNYLRPVYLIFDQLEELFILGTPEEQEAFAREIKKLIDAQLYCRILLIMREEFIGYLYELEKIIPSVFEYQLRIGRMSNEKVKTVISASFDKFNVTLSPNTDTQLKQIIETVSGKRSLIHLPYLQVFLDQLYLRVYHNTFDGQDDPGRLPPLVIRESDILDQGEIQDVLADFLARQESELVEDLEQTHPEVNAEKLHQILDRFVTREGTKRPFDYFRKDKLIHLRRQDRELMPAVSDAALSYCLEALENRRVLRFTDQTIELAHDSLAQLISRQRTDEERQLFDIYQRILGSFNDHMKTNGGAFLREKQLELYDPYLPRLHDQLKPPVLAFIENSRDFIAKEKARKQELQKQKIVIEQERKRVRLRNFFLLVAGILAGIALYSAGIARDALAKEKIEARERGLANAMLDMAMGQMPTAIDRLKAVDSLIVKGHVPPNPDFAIQDTIKTWTDIREKRQKANRLFATTDTDSVLKALSLYKQVLAKRWTLGLNSEYQEKIQLTREKIDSFLVRAEQFDAFSTEDPEWQCPIAQSALREARKLTMTIEDSVSLSRIETLLNSGQCKRWYDALPY